MKTKFHKLQNKEVCGQKENKFVANKPSKKL